MIEALFSCLPFMMTFNGLSSPSQYSQSIYYRQWVTVTVIGDEFHSLILLVWGLLLVNLRCQTTQQSLAYVASFDRKKCFGIFLKEKSPTSPKYPRLKSICASIRASTGSAIVRLLQKLQAFWLFQGNLLVSLPSLRMTSSA